MGRAAVGRAVGTVELLERRGLSFGPDDPVRAASGIARLGDGWLVVQDDAVDAAWWREPCDRVERVRLLGPRDGAVVFSQAAGTKRRKPDLETACTVPGEDGPAVLLLGSGSLSNRTDGVLVDLVDGDVRVRATDLADLHDLVGEVLGLDPAHRNLEGACVVGDRLRWFQRGHGGDGVPSSSVELDLAGVLDAVRGRVGAGAVEVGVVRHHDLGSVDGLPLAVTDAVALPDGRVCVTATAEDAPDAVADGPVAGSVLALLDGDDVRVLELPGEVAHHKVEGLALVGASGDGSLELLAVVDDDDPGLASPLLRLRVTDLVPVPGEVR